MDNEQPYRFIVLVPHRDTVVILKKENLIFFTKGLEGILNLPHYAVLKKVKEPLVQAELKKEAQKIKTHIKKNNGKKIKLFPPALFNLSDILPDDVLPLKSLLSDYILIGRKIDLYNYAKTLIPLALIKNKQKEKCKKILDEEDFTEITFSAAYIANMAVKQNKNKIYWKTGIPAWLPSSVSTASVSAASASCPELITPPPITTSPS